MRLKFNIVKRVRSKTWTSVEYKTSVSVDRPYFLYYDALTATVNVNIDEFIINKLNKYVF